MEAGEAGALTILEHVSESGGGSESGKRGHGEGDQEAILNFGEPLVDVSEDGSLVLFRDGAIVPIFEGNEHHGGIRGGRTIDDGISSHREDILHAGDVSDDFTGAGNNFIGPLQGGPIRELDIDHAIAFIFLWDEAGGEFGESKAGEADDTGEDHRSDHGAADRNLHCPGGCVGGGIDCAVEELEEAAGFFAVLAQKDGTERGAQREGVDGAEDCGNRDGDGELLEECAGDAGDEDGGDEDRQEDQGGGDDGAGNLPHGNDGGFLWILAVLNVANDVLDHHDGVIDHDSDDKDESEEGELVDGEAQHLEHGESADEGDRDSEGRDNGGPEVLQEYVDREYDQ